MTKIQHISLRHREPALLPIHFPVLETRLYRNVFIFASDSKIQACTFVFIILLDLYCHAIYFVIYVWLAKTKLNDLS